MSQPLRGSFITCDYGVPGSWAAGHHTGVDYAASPGTPVYATHAGRVVAVGWSSWGEAYGLHVVIASTARNGTIIHHGYCHLSSTRVTAGQRVIAGEALGKTGETGRTFGPHLHYEERRPPHLYDTFDREPRFPGMRQIAARRLRRKRRNHPNAKRGNR